MFFATSRNNNVLHAISNMQLALIIDLADVTGVYPAVNNRFASLILEIKVTVKLVIVPNQNFAGLIYADFNGAYWLANAAVV